jgi:hypothetical protein
LLILAGLLALVYIIATTVSFINTRDQLPRGTTLAEADVSGLTASEAISKTTRALQGPVLLRYQSQNITLLPAEVDFGLDEAAVQTSLEEVIADNRGFDTLLQLLLRQPITGSPIAVLPQFSPAKLDVYLDNLAQTYDKAPQSASPNLESQQVGTPQPGLALNVIEARQLVLDALSSTTDRAVDLPLDVLPSNQTSVASLEASVRERLAGFTQIDGNFAGVFVKDLRTGEEMRLNSDVAFSAQGWLKIALVLETYRLSADPIPPPIATLLEAVTLQGSNASANELLRTLGQADAQLGADQMNDTLRKLGLLSTFLAQPFGQDGLATNVVTPANSRAEAAITQPDPNAQSTPAQMASLLETIEQCRNGVGALPLAFEGAFTPAKCTQILDLLARNRINALIEAGSPGASVAHRQSWNETTHSDAALVRSAGGTYIIVVALHSRDPLIWADTSVLIADIARLTFALFNGQVPPAVGGIGAPPAP